MYRILQYRPHPSCPAKHHRRRAGTGHRIQHCKPWCVREGIAGDCPRDGRATMRAREGAHTGLMRKTSKDESGNGSRRGRNSKDVVRLRPCVWGRARPPFLSKHLYSQHAALHTAGCKWPFPSNGHLTQRPRLECTHWCTDVRVNDSMPMPHMPHRRLVACLCEIHPRGH